MPVTSRGAGTGNYGQAVPLHGGVILDLAKMDRIEEILPEGVASASLAFGLGCWKERPRKWDGNCDVIPQTLAKASVGGFLGGGSGGIGSVANGNLRDFNTVRAIEVVTMEAQPSHRVA